MIFTPFAFMGGTPAATGLPAWPAIPTESEITTFLSGLASTGTTTLSTVTLTNSAASIGGVLAPNGSIYFIPFGSGKTLKFDTSTETDSLIGTSYGSNDQWFAGALHTDGKIYCCPWNQSSILVIDPTTDTTTTITPTGFPGGSAKYAGVVMGPNEKLYFTGYNQNNIGVYDPATNTWSTITTNVPTGNAAYQGGALAPNGSIYYAPRAFGKPVLKLDTSNDTVTQLTTPSLVSAAFNGCTLGGNGKIYGNILNEDESIEIDPSNDTVTKFGSISSGGDKFYGGGMAGDGNVYLGNSNNGGGTLQIDVTVPDLSVITTVTTTNQRYPVLAPNGSLYSSIFGTTMTKITPSTAALPADFGDGALSPYLNGI